MNRPIRTLVFSTLYPSSARPVHGIFVETRLRELLSAGGIQTQVVAPVPWFPSTHRRWGKWARMAGTPLLEIHNGIEVHHPRYLLPPKVGMTMAPLLIALAAAPVLRRLRRSGFDFDVIDAHYYYPDGVAAALLSRWFARPVTITARGSDLNLLPRYYLPRRMIQWAAHRAEASIGVCGALIDVLRAWGIAEERLHVMRNGVDLGRFQPRHQGDVRAALGLEGSPLLLSVGNLIELKGHHLVLDALKDLLPRFPHARLAIVGAGEERAKLENQARALEVQDRVVFAGQQPNERLSYWYSAADVMVLASSREGWANVLLEAMACGTPVVATEVGGTPEVVVPEVGVLISERTGRAIAGGVERLLALSPQRAAVRRYAEGFSWERTSLQQLSLFARLAKGASGA